MLAQTDAPAEWAPLLDGDWPLPVASEVALLAWGLTMPVFRGDRLPCPEALRRIERLLVQPLPPDGAAAAESAATA
eukprot:7147519-Prymnesium_polylepis.1